MAARLFIKKNAETKLANRVFSRAYGSRNGDAEFMVRRPIRKPFVNVEIKTKKRR